MTPPTTPDGPGEPSREDMMSALFAQMVLQQTNLALLLLGRVPHPETGKTEKDVDAARAFIDQLEMLEFKTKGNLNPQEAAFLKDALMSVRMAFVEAVQSSEPPKGATPPAPAPEKAAAPASETPPATEGASAAPEGESRKKFAKKY